MNKYTRTVYQDRGPLRAVWNKVTGEVWVIFTRGGKVVYAEPFEEAIKNPETDANRQWLDRIKKLVRPTSIKDEYWENKLASGDPELENQWRAQTARTGGVGITFEGPVKQSRVNHVLEKNK